MVTIQVSFMMSGPTFELSIPESLDAVPTAMSPIQLPNGARECVFTPIAAGRPTYTRDDHDPSFEIAGRDGPVWVTRRHLEPLHWFLEWRLDSGTVQTHVRDEDGEDMIQVVADRLQVEADRAQPPTLLPHPPLGRAASRAPGYAERIDFANSYAKPTRSIELLRPGSSSRAIREADGVVYIGTRVGIDLRGVGVGPGELTVVRDQLERQVYPGAAR